MLGNFGASVHSTSFVWLAQDSVGGPHPEDLRDEWVVSLAEFRHCPYGSQSTSKKARAFYPAKVFGCDSEFCAHAKNVAANRRQDNITPARICNESRAMRNNGALSDPRHDVVRPI